MSEFNAALIPGDGIGPEIVSAAVTVLDAVCKKYGHTFNYTEVYMGGCAIDKFGVPLPDETIDICKKSYNFTINRQKHPQTDAFRIYYSILICKTLLSSAQERTLDAMETILHQESISHMNTP